MTFGTTTNIKCHFKIRNKLKFRTNTSDINVTTSTGKKINFHSLFQLKKVTIFTFEKNNSHDVVNISGITRFKKVKSICLEIVNKFKLLRSTKIIVDNSTYNFKFNLKDGDKYIDLRNFKEQCFNKTRLFLDENVMLKLTILNPERFPALRIRTNIGTLNVFKTAKCVIVGAKSLSSNRKLEKIVKKEYQVFIKTK